MYFQIENCIYDTEQPHTSVFWNLINDINTIEIRNGHITKVVEQLETLRSNKYHNLNHIYHLVNVAKQMDRHGCFATWEFYENLIHALVFHDIVYVPGSKNNEADSAEFFRTSCRAMLPNTDMERIYNAIMATTHTAPVTDGLAQLVCDIDLVGLASHPAIFNANSEAIRQEYHFVDDVTYKNARIAFFRKLLNRPSIYQSVYFRTAAPFVGFEQKAKNNIENHIRSLEI